MNKQYKTKPADIGEAVFDITYLAFDFVAGIIFITQSNRNTLFILYGILAFTLMAGDAFHLVPRVVRAIKGPSDKVQRYMGLGLGISSVTMTIFYILLLYIWKATFPELMAPLWVELLIWISALLRIAICLLPQNHWITGKGSMTFSIIRNSIFLFTGIGVIVLYAISGNAKGLGLYKMIIAIAISFGCYIPVVWGAKKKPKLGMLMIPKTCAYIWMLIMGLMLLRGIPGDISLSEISDNYEARQEGYLEKNQVEVSSALVNASGSLIDYAQNSDGTWECEGHIYKYKLEITGRMSNAVSDTTFVYLSNIKEITFDQAWKAAGLSSNSNDYFNIKDAILVDWINKE